MNKNVADVLPICVSPAFPQMEMLEWSAPGSNRTTRPIVRCSVCSQAVQNVVVKFELFELYYLA